MNLYLISQSVNTGWDTFDSAVVAARTPEIAKHIHPGGSTYQTFRGNPWWEASQYSQSVWAQPDKIEVTFIGLAKTDTEEGVICASFNAG